MPLSRRRCPKPSNGAKAHHAALPPAKVATAIARIRASAAGPAIKLGLEFLILTATRSGEVRGARWEEIDSRGARVWTVPAARMKRSRDHRVPVVDAGGRDIGGSPRALELQRPDLSALPSRQDDLRWSILRPVEGVGGRVRAAWLPVVISGLVLRTDGRAARGGGGRARAHRLRCHRAGVSANRLVRASPQAHGVVVSVPKP